MLPTAWQSAYRWLFLSCSYSMYYQMVRHEINMQRETERLWATSFHTSIILLVQLYSSICLLGPSHSPASVSLIPLKTAHDEKIPWLRPFKYTRQPKQRTREDWKFSRFVNSSLDCGWEPLRESGTGIITTIVLRTFHMTRETLAVEPPRKIYSAHPRPSSWPHSRCSCWSTEFFL